MTKALICIDFIEEIVGESGKLSGKGYRSFALENQTFKHVKSIQEKFRAENLPIIHVKVAFKDDYSDQPKKSPLFGKADEFQALKINTPATDFVAEVAPIDDEKVIVKNRVSAFYGTELHAYLQSLNVNELYICGVATDLAIEAAVRDAHDRDYEVTVIEKACAAANKVDHDNSINTLAKLATIF